MKQKGFAPILTILIIAVLGVAGYFVYRNYQKQQTVTPRPISNPIQTNNWKTYANSKYGFSISYPPPFFLFSSASTHMSTQEQVAEINEGGVTGLQLAIRVVPNGANLSAKQYVQKYIDRTDANGNTIDPDFKKASFTEKTINTYNFTIIEGLSNVRGQICPCTWVTNEKDGIFFYTEGSGDSDNGRAKLIQILSTFKFTK